MQLGVSNHRQATGIATSRVAPTIFIQLPMCVHFEISRSLGTAPVVQSSSHGHSALIEALRFACRTPQPFQQLRLACVAIRQAKRVEAR